MMTEQQLRGYSRLLAKVLRHQPELWGIELEAEGGWTNVNALLRAARLHGTPLTREMLDEIVARNDKHRYDYDETGTKIRANQGHSVSVDLGLTPLTPPDVLYHGTTGAFLGSIFAKGLLPMSRQYVHLSKDVPTAIRVGRRHGKPVVLQIDCQRMVQQGYKFYLSANNVWLTDTVPPEFLQFLTQEAEPEQEAAHAVKRLIWREDDLPALREKYPGGLHFVVGDTHGEGPTLHALMQHIGFDPEKDHVYLLGDYNAGSDVTGLLSYIACHYEPDLQKPGFHLIRGNHERELSPRYYLENLPDVFVLRMPQMTYYLAHAGMVTAAFDALNEAFSRTPEETALAFRLDPGAAHGRSPLAQLYWSRNGLYSQRSNGRLWPTEENLRAHRACILHGHTPYSFFCDPKPQFFGGYGSKSVFLELQHAWFSEDLQSFNLDADIKGRNKNGEIYRGLACLCLEACDEIAASAGGRLTAEALAAAPAAVFSVPIVRFGDGLPRGELSRILNAAPKQQTMYLAHDGNIYIA